jgi:hypothetical protein
MLSDIRKRQARGERAGIAELELGLRKERRAAFGLAGDLIGQCGM